MRIFFVVCIISGLMLCCNNKSEQKNEPPKPLTREQQIQKNIDSLKQIARDGDLVTRMNDNILSYQARQLNETDKSFSHAGVVVTRNNTKMICHIIPEKAGADTVTFEPIDSFINPRYNILCGLFRYELSDSDRVNFVNELILYHDKEVRFDSVYNFQTDNKVYCSEMISKALIKTTNGRITFKMFRIPERMLPLVYRFFGSMGSKKTIRERKFITIDNLYMLPQCKELMRFTLKYFPGQ